MSAVVMPRAPPRIAAELGRGWLARGLAEHRDARLLLAEVGAEVDADPARLEPREVLGHPVGRDWRAALASDRGRDALLQLVLRPAVLEQGGARVVHHVDPPRAHELAGGVELGAPVT